MKSNEIKNYFSSIYYVNVISVIARIRQADLLLNNNENLLQFFFFNYYLVCDLIWNVIFSNNVYHSPFPVTVSFHWWAAYSIQHTVRHIFIRLVSMRCNGFTWNRISNTFDEQFYYSMLYDVWCMVYGVLSYDYYNYDYTFILKTICSNKNVLTS